MAELLYSMLMTGLILLVFLKLPLWDAPRQRKPRQSEGFSGAAPVRAQPQAQSKTPPETAQAEPVPDAEAVRTRTEQVIDALQANAALLQDAEFADCLARICTSLNLLAEKAEADAHDLPAVLRFLDRYGEHTRKLAKNYAMLARAAGKTEAMRQSMQQLKQMLEELAQAYERFHLSLYQHDVRQADEEIALLRSMLSQDGLAGAYGTAAPHASTSLSEAQTQHGRRREY